VEYSKCALCDNFFIRQVVGWLVRPRFYSTAIPETTAVHQNPDQSAKKLFPSARGDSCLSDLGREADVETALGPQAKQLFKAKGNPILIFRSCRETAWHSSDDLLSSLSEAHEASWWWSAGCMRRAVPCTNTNVDA
jgi:hypothetical protein